MIIACPACTTRYVVPDSAIGVDGRTVRCAKCKHSWFQEGPELDLAEAPVEQTSASPPPPPPPPAPTVAREQAQPEPEEDGVEDTGGQPGAHIDDQVEAEFSPADYRSSDSEPADAGVSETGLPPSPVDESEAERAQPEPAPHSEPDFGYTEQDEPTSSLAEEPVFDEQDVSQFDYEPPFRPRRNILKYWTWAAAIFAIVALGAVAAFQYFGMPSWAPFERPLFGAVQPDLEIQFPVDQQELRTLEDGTTYFSARIIVTNTARETRPLPNMLIVLRDQKERKVFDWVVVPPQNELAPGEVLTINEAITEIPRAAVFADIGWAVN